MRAPFVRLGLATLLLLAGSGIGRAAEWQLVDDQSRLAVAFKQGASEVDGQFQRFGGTIGFDPADLEHSKIEIHVDLTSLSTGDSGRDGQAQSDAWLDSGSAKEAVYRTTSIAKKTGDVYEVEADLTLKGKTQHLRHEATITIADGKAHAVGDVTLHRLDFGVGQAADPSGNTVALDVAVHFDVQAVQVR